MTSKVKQPAFSKIFAAHDSPAERAAFAAVAWQTCAGEMDDTLTAARAATLRRYVLMLTEFEFAFSASTHEGIVLKGKNGGDVFSMKFSAILKLNDALSRLEDQLCLSPRSVGARPAKPSTSPPAAADKYLARARGEH